MTPRLRAWLASLCLAALGWLVLTLPGAALVSQPWVTIPETGGGNIPTAMAFAPDGRLFVALRGTPAGVGSVRVVVGGVMQSAPVLTESVQVDSHRGLLGIALHPQFATNGYLFVYFTEQATQRNVVYRYQVAANNTVVAGSRIKWFDTGIASTASNIGGALLFGTDGALYVSVGDHCQPDLDECRRFRHDDTPSPADCPTLNTGLCNVWPQRTNDVRGKILRLDGNTPPDCDMNGHLCGRPAAGNPFMGDPSPAARLVYAWGLRNVFGMTLRSSDGQLFATDNGSSIADEVNLIVPGGNYGWPAREGRTDLPGSDAPMDSPIDPEVIQDSSGITSLVFNTRVAEYGVGRLLVCDYVTGSLRAYDMVSKMLVSTLATGVCTTALAIGSDGLYWTTNNAVIRTHDSNRSFVPAAFRQRELW